MEANDEIKEFVRRLNNQYKNISCYNHGEYWQCNLCGFNSEDFGLVREHHMEHELLKILNELDKSGGR